jgi:threonine dehydrogenase-like Zn-dependent dehydrogenase
MKQQTKNQSHSQDLQAQIDALIAENVKLKLAQTKASKPRALSLKVSQKGAVSVYGMGRFPVTLYAAQWLRLIGFAEQITQFINDHRSELAEK